MWQSLNDNNDKFDVNFTVTVHILTVTLRENTVAWLNVLDKFCRPIFRKKTCLLLSPNASNKKTTSA